jgi:hypothetical protein
LKVSTRAQRRQNANQESSALENEFRILKREHREAMKARAALIVLGSSVIRVFKAETKTGLCLVLVSLPVDELAQLKPEEFVSWYNRQLNRVAREVRRLNHVNARIQPGLKWGHSAKVLSLYLRDLVLHTQYFSRTQAKRISPWLYAPIDGIVIRKLKGLHVKISFRSIREIDSKSKFTKVQKTLGTAAELVGIPRVWFDDNWARRDGGK